MANSEDTFIFSEEPVIFSDEPVEDGVMINDIGKIVGDEVADNLTIEEKTTDGDFQLSQKVGSMDSESLDVFRGKFAELVADTTELRSGLTSELSNLAGQIDSNLQGGNESVTALRELIEELAADLDQFKGDMPGDMVQAEPNVPYGTNDPLGGLVPGHYKWCIDLEFPMLRSGHHKVVEPIVNLDDFCVVKAIVEESPGFEFDLNGYIPKFTWCRWNSLRLSYISFHNADNFFVGKPCRATIKYNTVVS